MRMSLLFGNSASDGLTAAASSTSGLALSSDLKRATSSKMAHRMLRPRTERKLFVVTWMMTLFDKVMVSLLLSTIILANAGTASKLPLMYRKTNWA